ncbi:MAG TPA: response regulator [Gemmatimonadales bacterium]|nr:response regulator [Gemmatimonadales bacterium]
MTAPRERDPGLSATRILLLEDNAADAELIVRELRKLGGEPEIRRAGRRAEFEQALAEYRPDLILSDHNLPDLTGRAALDLARAALPDVPFILVTGSLDEEAAVGYMKAGAADYVLKDRLLRLSAAVSAALEQARERAINRELERQLQQAQKMEAIGRLAGGIAHDFNNLLTAIIGYADLLAENLADRPGASADLDEIRRAAERAADLTRRLLAFSRKQILEPRVVDLNALVTDFERMLRRLIGEDVELRLALAPELGLVRADPGQLEQVIMNLAVNARDAMPSGGKLAIETANVELDAAYAARHVGVTPGRYVMLAVSDTGTGMDQATKARLFEPFFTTKPPGKGTGLGLSMVYGIVKQSGGNIWVYSEPGRGTTFKIYLPQVEAGEEPEAAAGPIRDTRGTETVLVVEDAEPVRTLARRVLEERGYRVLEAQTAAEAQVAAELHRGPLDLILTDVVLPDLSGRELAERLTARWPALKVLYMSGYTDDSIVQHGVLEAGVAYLQKPFTPESLAAKVRGVLDGTTGLRSKPEST